MGPELNRQTEALSRGLYLVATPIGSARDITLRALDILAGADVIAAEDTRSMKRLLDIHGVALGGRPLIAYHEHNGAKVRPRLMAMLDEGKSVAYASEAGTPLIADPGYDLAREARDAGVPVTTAPGPSAVVAALTIAGLPTDAFFFGGFLPSARAARRSALEKLRDVPGTLAFYESPRRTAAMLRDSAEILGTERQAAMCRELTKKFEECRRGTLADLADQLAEESLKGEVVILIDRPGSRTVSEDEIRSALKSALETMSVRDASSDVADALGVPRKQVYRLALAVGGRK